MEITFANFTRQEIQDIAMKGDAGATRSDVTIKPGERYRLVDASSSRVREVTIDSRRQRFVFNDFTKLENYSTMTLEFSIDANDRPHLTLDEKSVGGPVDGAHIYINVVGTTTDLASTEENGNAPSLAAFLPPDAMAVGVALYSATEGIPNDEELGFASERYILDDMSDDGSFFSGPFQQHFIIMRPGGFTNGILKGNHHVHEAKTLAWSRAAAVSRARPPHRHLRFRREGELHDRRLGRDLRLPAA
jgi:hypothetical protein